MNADWKAIVGTLGIFVAGLVAGVVTLKLGEHAHRAPFPMMREFGPHSGPGEGWRDQGQGRPGLFDRHEEGLGRGEGFRGRPAFLTPEFEKEMRDYHEKLKAVLDPYGAKIRGVLSADQQKRLEQARQEGPGASRNGGGGREEGPEHLEGPEGGMRFIGMIIYRPLLDRMTRDLQLDAKQQAQLEALFKERREALLKFLDANPPPTIKMALEDRPPVPPDAAAPGAPVPPPVPAPVR